MLVHILKSFPCVADERGLSSRDLAAGTVENVPDDLVPGLVAEGYVSTGDVVQGVAVSSPLAGAGEAVQAPTSDAVTGEQLAPVKALPKALPKAKRGKAKA